MCGQRHDGQDRVNGTEIHRYPLIVGQQGHGEDTVGNEYPYNPAHQGPGRILSIHPYTMTITRTKGTRITQIVKVIHIVIILGRRRRCAAAVLFHVVGRYDGSATIVTPRSETTPQRERRT